MTGAAADPLAPAPIEIALAAAGLVTIVYCVAVALQWSRGRVPARRAAALVVLAWVLPVAGVVWGVWLERRARPAGSRRRHPRPSAS